MRRTLAFVGILTLVCGLATPAHAQLRGRGYALCVGVDRHPVLGKLNGSRIDADATARALSASGFDSVLLLTDGAPRWEHRATYANIRARIQDMAALARGGDRVVVYLAGPGIALDGRSLFLPSDGDGRTGIPISWICDTLSTCQAGTKLIILDVVGPEIPAAGDAGFQELLAQINPGTAPILSSRASTGPSHLAKNGGSVFTQKVLEALDGKADEDGNGLISQREFCDGVVRAMKGWTGPKGVTQAARVIGVPAFLALSVPTDAELLKRRGDSHNGVTPEMRSDALRKALAAGGAAKPGKAEKEAIRRAIRLAPGDSRAAETDLDKGKPIGPILRGRVRFTMHRSMIVNANGTTTLHWKFGGESATVSFPFSGDTHQIVGEVSLPAGEYAVSLQKWEHQTNLGSFSDGPYPASAATFIVMPGGTHEFVIHDRQTGGPHGVSTIYYDGLRVCRTESITKKTLLSTEIDREDAKGAPGAQVQSFVITSAGQRQAKLYSGALNYATQAMVKAMESSNRVLAADASREMAFLLATAADPGVRDPKKALALAEQGLSLAVESGIDPLWPYRDALAAALAAGGKFSEAAQVASQAESEARGQKPYAAPPHILDGLAERTKTYQANQAWVR